MFEGGRPSGMRSSSSPAPFADPAAGFVIDPSSLGAPQVHVLGELASAGTLSFASSQAVRIVRIVLNYRIECKKIELRRE